MQHYQRKAVYVDWAAEMPEQREGLVLSKTSIFWKPPSCSKQEGVEQHKVKRQQCYQPRPEILSRLPARKQSQSHTIQLSSQSNPHHHPVLITSIQFQLYRSGYNSKCPLPQDRLCIDQFFPAGVHQLTHHARLTPAGHTFQGHARPRPNNTPQPDLGLIERPEGNIPYRQ